MSTDFETAVKRNYERSKVENRFVNIEALLKGHQEAPHYVIQALDQDGVMGSNTIVLMYDNNVPWGIDSDLFCTIKCETKEIIIHDAEKMAKWVNKSRLDATIKFPEGHHADVSYELDLYKGPIIPVQDYLAPLIRRGYVITELSLNAEQTNKPVVAQQQEPLSQEAAPQPVEEENDSVSIQFSDSATPEIVPEHLLGTVEEVKLEKINYQRCYRLFRQSTPEATHTRYFTALTSPKLDSSSFILLSLASLESILGSRLKDSEKDAILEDYAANTYDETYHQIQTICQSHVELKTCVVMRLLKDKPFTKNDNPYHNQSRRFWELILASGFRKNISDDDLKTMERFFSSSFEALGLPIKDKKVYSLENAENLFTKLRKVIKKNQAMNKSEKDFRAQSSLDAQKDRADKKRYCKEKVPSLHPGILRSIHPCFVSYLNRMPEKGRIVDTLLLDEKMQGYSFSHKTVPFVGSVSGTTFTWVIFLQAFMEKNQGQTQLERWVNQVLKGYITIALINGFHSLNEIQDVLKSPEVTQLFAKFNVKINTKLPKELIYLAYKEAQNYALEICLKDLVHAELASELKQESFEILSSFSI